MLAGAAMTTSSATPLFPTTIAGSLPKPAWLAAPNRLWAPWRYEYLQRAIAGPKVCIFCFGRLDEAERQKRLVLFENRYAAVMLNRYPYINGHIMVAPREHLASPELVSTKTRAVINDLIADAVAACATVRATGLALQEPAVRKLRAIRE